MLANESHTTVISALASLVNPYCLIHVSAPSSGYEFQHSKWVITLAAQPNVPSLTHCGHGEIWTYPEFLTLIL